MRNQSYLIRSRHQIYYFRWPLPRQIRKKGKTSRMHLCYTAEESGLPTISFNKRDQEIAKTIEKFDQIVARIEAKDYTVKARPIKFCETCDMKHSCDYKNWSC